MATPDKYDKQQEQYLGPPSSGYKLAQGSGAFAPIIGDALYYTEEGSNPRWINLTKLLGSMFWSALQSGPWSTAVTGVTGVILNPTNAQSSIALNPVSFQMQLTSAGSGRIQSIDGFSWSCNVQFRFQWDTNGLANHFISFHIYKNGVDTGFANGAYSGAGIADRETSYSTWMTIDPNDIIDIRAKDSDGSSTLRLYIMNVDIVANRLLT